MANTTPIEIMMSSTRLYEALKAEYNRTGDEVLVRRWNAHCVTLTAKLERAAAARKRGLPASIMLGYGYGAGFRST